MSTGPLGRTDPTTGDSGNSGFAKFALGAMAVLLLVAAGGLGLALTTTKPADTSPERPTLPDERQVEKISAVDYNWEPKGYRNDSLSLASDVSATGEFDKVEVVAINASEYSNRPYKHFERSVRVAAAYLNDRPKLSTPPVYDGPTIKYKVKPNASNPDHVINFVPRPHGLLGAEYFFYTPNNGYNALKMEVSGEYQQPLLMRSTVQMLARERGVAFVRDELPGLRWGYPEMEYDPVVGGGTVVVSVNVTTEKRTLGRKAYVDIAEKQVAFWNEAGPIYGTWFRPLEVRPNASDPDIRLRFTHHSEGPLGPGIAGNAPTFRKGNRFHRDPVRVFIATRPGMDNESKVRRKLHTTVRHELGHVFGLEHSETMKMINDMEHPTANSTSTIVGDYGFATYQNE